MTVQRYDRSMTTKIAVSLPDELVAEAREAVRSGRADSVSAYVAEAMAQMARRETLDVVLADWREEVGPVTEDDDAWVRQVLGLDAP